MSEQLSQPDYKSGFVAVMGRPNVGKSTLINSFMGQKIASVSPRPQTTRKTQLGILTIEGAQIIFVDTPGVHKPIHKLGENMNQEALKTLQECDLIIWIVDLSQSPHQEDKLLAIHLQKVFSITPMLLVLNKADLVVEETRGVNRKAYTELLPGIKSITISATRGDNLERLMEMILEEIPPGDPFYPSGQITDLFEREITADLIRESALNILRDEIPHGIAVRIDTYKERGNHGAYIEATLFVEKESHKPIVIGANGKMLKEIGTAARQEIESMSGRKVYLKIRVKVRKNWRDDEKILRRFGY